MAAYPWVSHGTSHPEDTFLALDSTGEGTISLTEPGPIYKAYFQG